jgi:mxaJ protein
MMIRALCILAALSPVTAWAGNGTNKDALEHKALRVCSDPNNLPFSNRAGEGFENQLAEIISRAMGKPVKYFWWAQRRGFIRNTLDAGRCDVVMGIPAGSELVLTTRPYYISTYALVYRKDADYNLHSLDDPILHKLTIGLHFIGDDYSNPPPAEALARRGIVRNVVGYSIYGDYRKPNPPARLIEAVANGAIDVAIAWGPFAGYFAKRQRIELKVVPLETSVIDLSTPFEYSISLGVRKHDGKLQTKLDRILDRKWSKVHELLSRYKVPLVESLPPPRQVSLK